MSQPVYDLRQPAQARSSVIFASPHSGRNYPPELMDATVLDSHAIRSSEDAFVDQLFGAVTAHGAPLLLAVAPRAFVDLNRSADDLDPAVIEGMHRRAQSPRVSSGLGVIPRVVANGRAIYRGKISRIEAERRIAEHWYPYHRMLERLMTGATEKFGEAILIDCHSMPHEAVAGIAGTLSRRPQIVIGDRFGASASAAIADRVEAAFAGAGLEVTRNAPFAGAYVTQAYGRPSQNRHAIQIEIDRSLYMDEARIVPNANFERFRDLLTRITAEIVAIGHPGMRLAAE